MTNSANKKVRCTYCWDKGYSTELIGGTRGYPDFGSLEKVQFSGMEERKNYCTKCRKGKRLKKYADITNRRKNSKQS